LIVRGISPQEEATVTELAAKLRDTTLARLVPGSWSVVLGRELARSLAVREGDKVTVVLPGCQVTPAGIVPRLRTLTVVGTFDAGHYEYDSGLALVALDDAAKLYKATKPGILRVTPNIKYAKDRGKEPPRDSKEFPWFKASTDRINDHHLSLEEKRRARGLS
jgi:lipoprotein-releasing system permease protein